MMTNDDLSGMILSLEAIGIPVRTVGFDKGDIAAAAADVTALSAEFNVIGPLTADMVSDLFARLFGGTAWMNFHSPLGLKGLARVTDGGERLDILAIASIENARATSESSCALQSSSTR
jgi:hypothetical protein